MPGQPLPGCPGGTSGWWNEAEVGEGGSLQRTRVDQKSHRRMEEAPAESDCICIQGARTSWSSGRR